MKREIKFIAFDKKKNRMFEVYGLGQDWVTENTLDGVDEGNNCFSGEEFKSRIEIMQFTGLKDITGKEIYEGDILEFPFELGIAYVINDGFRFAVKSPGSEAVDYESQETLQQSKIIGNIYENPELINN